MANARTLIKTTQEKNDSVEETDVVGKNDTIEENDEIKGISVSNILKEQEKMAKLIAEQNEIIKSLQEKASKPQQNIISLDGIDKVTVVHLKDYPTSIKLSNNKMILLQKLKQTQEITRSEALELVSSFPKAFEKGWITLTGEIGQQILESNSIIIDNETINSIFNYREAIKFGKDELSDYYDNLMPAQKDMFVSWWYNEASADKEEFLNLETVNCLNKISNGRFSKLIKEKITNVM